jgi:uncharacterized protein (TIGR02328 family)
MRLWHYKLLPYLPRQQLLGQHRECAALRGKGWGKKHATVNYVFRYSYECLFEYHLKVIEEMKNRNYFPDPVWERFEYRGKNSPELRREYNPRTRRWFPYPEHDTNYLKLCIQNLNNKIQNAPVEKYNRSEVYKFIEYKKEIFNASRL